MSIAWRMPKATDTYNMKFLLLFYYKNDPQYYVIRILPVLFSYVKLGHEDDPKSLHLKTSFEDNNCSVTLGTRTPVAA